MPLVVVPSDSGYRAARVPAMFDAFKESGGSRPALPTDQKTRDLADRDAPSRIPVGPPNRQSYR